MDSEMVETIRENARYYRLAKGISGETIGKAVGHDHSWVQAFEAGTVKRPKTNDLVNLAKVLGMRLSDLIKPIPGLPRLYISPEEQRKGMENLERIRKRNGCSQRKFSEFLGMSADHYNKVLHGRANFSAKAWMKISDQLQIPLEQLLGRDAE